MQNNKNNGCFNNFIIYFTIYQTVIVFYRKNPTFQEIGIRSTHFCLRQKKYMFIAKMAPYNFIDVNI